MSADLTQFGWSVLDSIVTKMDRLNQPIPVEKVDATVAAELLAAQAIERKAFGKPRGWGKGQGSAFYPTETGRMMLAAHKTGAKA